MFGGVLEGAPSTHGGACCVSLPWAKSRCHASDPISGPEACSVESIIPRRIGRLPLLAPSSVGWQEARQLALGTRGASPNSGMRECTSRKQFQTPPQQPTPSPPSCAHKPTPKNPPSKYFPPPQPSTPQPLTKNSPLGVRHKLGAPPLYRRPPMRPFHFHHSDFIELKNKMSILRTSNQPPHPQPLTPNSHLRTSANQMSTFPPHPVTLSPCQTPPLAHVTTQRKEN